MNRDQLITLCQKYQAVLLNSDDQVITIAIVGPPPAELTETLHFSTKKRLNIESWDREQMDEYQRVAKDSHLPIVKDNNGNVVDLLNHIMKQALALRASDIHFEPSATILRIRIRVDGVLHPLPDCPSTLNAPLVARLKVLGNLDIAERRLPQDGQFAVDINGSSISFRIATLPCRGGEKVVLRLLHQVQQVLDIRRLGFAPLQLESFSHALNQPQGLILVTGPTGSGKTVTLYSALQSRNQREVNICSVEDPLEIPIEGINQTQINTRAGLTFQGVLRALLRQDPDIIMVGEIRDTETAEIAIKAAQTGHLVLSTLHTNSTSETLIRLQQMGVARWMISSALVLVVAQRLVRRLCPHCQKQSGTQTELPTSLWPRSLPNWCAPGCDRCYNGYHGRVALFEVLQISPQVKQAIINGASPSETERVAREAGMSILFEQGCEAIERGQTTLEELIRVLGLPNGE